MKQTKKPTYKELEMNRNFWIVVSIMFFISFFFVIYEDSKEQLNQTEGKNYSCNFVGAIKPEDTRNCEDEFEYTCWMYSCDEFSMNKTNVYKVIKRCCEVIE